MLPDRQKRGWGSVGKEMFTQYTTIKGEDNAFGKAKEATFFPGLQFPKLIQKESSAVRWKMGFSLNKLSKLSKN